MPVGAVSRMPKFSNVELGTPASATDAASLPASPVVELPGFAVEPPAALPQAVAIEARIVM